jgi:hypothetical protein
MKNISKIAKVIGTKAMIAYAGVAAVSAQTVGEWVPAPTGNDTNLVQFVQRVLNLAISVAALIAVGVLVYSGIQYITAAGDENKIEKATKGITYAIIGLIVAFVSILIVNFVINEVLKTA